MIGSRYEREQAEAAELRRQYLAGGPRPPVGPPAPGRSPDERERLEAARKAAEAAREAERATRAQQAERDRRAALQEADRLREFKGRTDVELGRARADLRAAADAGNFESALAAAGRVAALELVSAEVVRAGKRLGAAHRGPLFYAISAGKV